RPLFVLAVLAASVAALCPWASGPGPAVHPALVPSEGVYAAWSWPYARSRLESAWDVTLGNPRVVIAVVGTGVTPVADLRGVLLPGMDLVEWTGDTTDRNGHGTAVASVAAARTNNGVGIAGVCGRCSVMPVRAVAADGNGSTTAVAEGVRWAAAHGANVVD